MFIVRTRASQRERVRAPPGGKERKINQTLSGLESIILVEVSTRVVPVLVPTWTWSWTAVSLAHWEFIPVRTRTSQMCSLLPLTVMHVSVPYTSAMILYTVIKSDFSQIAPLHHQCPKRA
ncbi:hypothetical protein DPEC_G00267750 [Dallia pectoralis]|uniref:Uncharacterized protein n=1 Tax=Dallia pectoralis TaxID=75939 RepID=A0ACC2FP28_DALPE|nr:hypothetical protein DPEC_G00267750 [Dallia pectoralis]